MMKKFLIFSVIILAAVLVTTSQRAKGEGIYVGSETCMECHDEWYESYMKNYHAIKGDPRTPAAKQGCESCHGPGAAHVESEGEEGTILVLNPK
jgi:mono/diheme cytochrome c family protein